MGASFTYFVGCKSWIVDICSNVGVAISDFLRTASGIQVMKASKQWDYKNYIF